MAVLRAKHREASARAGPPKALKKRRSGVAGAAAHQPKAGKTPKLRKPREKKLPPRLRARWGIFNSSVKQVAVFDYNQRGAADVKLAELRTKFKGLYYIQVVKDLMPEPVGAEALPV